MTILVVGAAGTIGRACLEELRGQPMKLVASDLQPPSIQGCESRAIDVTDLASVSALVGELDRDEPITGFIYAAGVNFTGHLVNTDWEQYQRVMRVNLQGAFHFGAALQHALLARPRRLSCVFLSSTAGLKGEAGGAVYSASKFGLLGFVQSFAAEIARFDSRANSVCPGNVDSPMLASLADLVAQREGRDGASVLRDFAAACAFDRLISPAEVAKTCSWLLSDASSGISGQTIVVDGPPR